MVIAVVNQKGGTGKTTTTVNLGSALARDGHQVLLIDLDPQGNLSYSLGVSEAQYTLGDILDNTVLIEDAVIEKESMDILSTSGELVKWELAQSDTGETAFLLKRALSEIEANYDYIIVDCPPSVSWLTINALSAANKVLIPIQLDVFSIQGLRQITLTVEEIREKYNSSLEIVGALAVMVDKRKNLTQEILMHLKNNFNIHVFNNQVRTNVKAAEAPSFGKSVVNYAPQSNSAKDYMSFAKELLELK